MRGMDKTYTPAQRALLWTGSIGPLGHAPASGTVTVAVVGIPLYYLAHTWPGWAYAIVVAVFSLASVWLHQQGDRLLGVKDSRKLVWDEIAGYLVAVAFLPFSWWLVLLSFLIERTLDIVKVPPANWIERRWPGGWGVVGDDIVAGLYALAILHILVRLFPSLAGA